MADHKAVNGKVINSLINAYFMGSSGLNELIELLRAVLNEEMWRDFIEDSTKEEKKFQSFSEFVQAPLPFGLGTDVKTLLNLCWEDKELCTLIAKEAKGKRGAPRGSRNAAKDKEIKSVQCTDSGTLVPETHPPRGNSRPAGLRKLQEDRPDLHERVLKDEISTHAAMVEAGFRVKQITMTFTSKDPLIVAKRLIKYFGDDVSREIMRELNGLLNQGGERAG